MAKNGFVTRRVARWAGDSALLGPNYTNLAASPDSKAKEFVFLKFDVDDAVSIAEDLAIASVPQFQVWFNGRPVPVPKSVTSGDLLALTATISKLYADMLGDKKGENERVV